MATSNFELEEKVNSEVEHNSEEPSFIVYSKYTEMDPSLQGRTQKFSGRPGTISLREFQAWFNGYTADLAMKYGDKYTSHYGFTQLQRFLMEEALLTYEQNKDKLT